MLTEYYGLTLMRMIRIKKEYEFLDKAIEEYNRCLEYAKKMDSVMNLYQGYATYNLGRAYYYKYCSTHSEEDKKKFISFMRDTIKTRKEWKDSVGFFRCFTYALSYEYFYAASENLAMKKDIDCIDDEEYQTKLKEIINDIDDYIRKDSELSKLYVVKDRCLSLSNKEKK